MEAISLACNSITSVPSYLNQQLVPWAGPITTIPETRNMTNADCLALLMGDWDDPPQEIENLLYRFLTSLFKRRLGILAVEAEGL